MNKILLTDGVFGTQLQTPSAGRYSTELLNMDNPAAVEAVAKSYIQAGSDIIMSNTLGANRITLKARGCCGTTPGHIKELRKMTDKKDIL